MAWTNHLLIDREGCCYTTCPQKHKLIHTRRKKHRTYQRFHNIGERSCVVCEKSSTRRVLPLRIDKVVWFVEMVPARAWFLLCGAWWVGMVSGIGGWGQKERKTTDEAVDGVAARWDETGGGGRSPNTSPRPPAPPPLIPVCKHQPCL